MIGFNSMIIFISPLLLIVDRATGSGFGLVWDGTFSEKKHAKKPIMHNAEIQEL